MPRIRDMATIRRVEKEKRAEERNPTPKPQPPRPQGYKGSDLSTAEIAQRVWFRAHQYCVKHNMPTEEHDGVVFLLADRPLAYFIQAEVPGLDEYVGGKQHVYDFLRQTTNAVNKGTPIDPRWLIRDDWHEGAAVMVFRRRRGADRIDEVAAKLSPQEAGEDRVPADVTVTRTTPTIPQAPQEAPVSHRHEPTDIHPYGTDVPAATLAAETQLAASASTRATEIPQARLTCPVCGVKFATPRQVQGHQASHTKRRTKAQMKQERLLASNQPANIARRLPAATHAINGVGKLIEGEHYTTLPGGHLLCSICDKEVESIRSLGPHYKTHIRTLREAQLAQLQAEILRLKQERNGKIAQIDMTPERALQVIAEIVGEHEQFTGQVLALTDARARIEELNEENDRLITENVRLMHLNDDLIDLKPTAGSGDLTTVLELIAEVIGKVQQGTYPTMRAIADIDDVVTAAKAGRKL